MERVRAHEAVLSARDPDLAVSHVIELEESGFAPTQAVPVDEIEEQKIARARLWNPAEETLDFFPREVLDCFFISALMVRHSAPVLRTAGDINAFPHCRLFTSHHHREYAQRNKSFRVRVAPGASKMSRRTTHVSRRSKTLIRDGRNDQRRRIRRLFIDRADAYNLTEAASIVGISRSTLVRDAEDDQREAYRADGRWRFSWRQVAFLALRRWTFAELHRALGTDAAEVLPPLLARERVSLCLPAYLVRAMTTAAARDRISLDEWLRLELVDFAGTVVDEMEELHPGFRRSYLFPGQE
jgi:hypothetical protein